MKIAVREIEFEEGGNTIWVHSPKGTTPLRIKCNGKIVVHRNQTDKCASIQIMLGGNIHVMLPAKKLTERGLAKMEKDLEEMGWTRQDCGGWEDPMGSVAVHLPTTEAHAVGTQRLKPRARK